MVIDSYIGWPILFRTNLANLFIIEEIDGPDPFLLIHEEMAVFF